MTRNAKIVLIVLGGFVALWIIGKTGESREEQAPAAAQAHVDYAQIAKDALTAAKIPQPLNIEVSDNRLILTYQREFNSERAAQTFAEDALMAVRNAAYKKGSVDFYRVTLNGKPPGPDMIRRIGSARYSEGGTVKWEFGK